MNCTIGTCSKCGGAVQIPAEWWSVSPPTPTCNRCGGVPKSAQPVIPMAEPNEIEFTPIEQLIRRYEQDPSRQAELDRARKWVKRFRR